MCESVGLSIVVAMQTMLAPLEHFMPCRATTPTCLVRLSSACLSDMVLSCIIPTTLCDDSRKRYSGDNEAEKFLELGMQGAGLDHGDHERGVGPSYASAHVEHSDQLQLRQEITPHSPDVGCDGWSQAWSTCEGTIVVSVGNIPYPCQMSRVARVKSD